MSEETEDTLSEFFAGYDRQIAELKQEGKKSLVEGKQSLSFSGIIYFAILYYNINYIKYKNYRIFVFSRKGYKTNGRFQSYYICSFIFALMLELNSKVCFCFLFNV